MTTNRFRATGLAVACALVASCETPSIPVAAAGYDPETLVPFIYHWSPGHDVAIYVDASNAPPDADLPAAVQGAIAAWEPVGQLGEVRLHTVSDVHAADVIIHFITTPRLVTSDVCNPVDIGAAGYTYICVDDTLHAVTFQLADGSGGHVKMDVAVSRTAVPDAAAFRSVVMHEFGHVLGIGAHSPNQADLMYGVPRAPKPTLADAQTLRFVLSQHADVRF